MAIPLYPETDRDHHRSSYERARAENVRDPGRPRLTDKRAQEVFGGLGGLFRDRESSQRRKERAELERYLEELPQIIEDLERFAQRSKEEKRTSISRRAAERRDLSAPDVHEQRREVPPMAGVQTTGPKVAQKSLRVSGNAPFRSIVAEPKGPSGRAFKVIPLAFLLLAVLLYIYVTLRVVFHVPLMGLIDITVIPEHFFIAFLMVIGITLVVNFFTRAVTLVMLRKHGKDTTEVRH